MSVAEAIQYRERQAVRDRLPLTKLFNPFYFERHPSAHRITEIVPGNQRGISVGDSIAWAEKDTPGSETPVKTISAGSVIAYAIEQVTGFHTDFHNIAHGGDAANLIRARLAQHTDLFRTDRRITTLVSAGVNTLGQELFGDPETFKTIFALSQLVDPNNRRFSPQAFKAPVHMYRALNNAYRDFRGLLYDFVNIHQETGSIDNIAVVGIYNFGRMNNLTVDLKTVPETHQEGVRNLAMNNRVIRGVSSMFARMTNNVFALAIEDVEAHVPADQRPNFHFIDTFNGLAPHQINLHPRMDGQIHIGQMVSKKLAYRGQPIVKHL